MKTLYLSRDFSGFLISKKKPTLENIGDIDYWVIEDEQGDFKNQRQSVKVELDYDAAIELCDLLKNKMLNSNVINIYKEGDPDIVTKKDLSKFCNNYCIQDCKECPLKKYKTK